MKVIKYLNSNGQAGNVELENYPKLCPSCRKDIEPLFCYAFGDYIDSFNTFMQVTFKCLECRSLFMGYYVSSKSAISSFPALRNTFLLKNPETFSNTITKISPRFEKIYMQARIAEESGLDEACGPTYRKSLEFLVKDYLISKSPKETDKIIKEKPLGKTLKRISDPNILACAERAVWLGNDEVHYERVWTNNDIHDMKLLIKLVISWIEYSKATDEFVKEMPIVQQKKA